MTIYSNLIPRPAGRHSIRQWLAAAVTLAALTGCSTDNDPENPTGGNGAPVTFGATIYSHEAHDNSNAPASRAIPDGTFDAGDRILIHIDGERKVFVYTDKGFIPGPRIITIPNVDPTPPEWKIGDGFAVSNIPR